VVRAADGDLVSKRQVGAESPGVPDPEAREDTPGNGVFALRCQQLVNDLSKASIRRRLDRARRPRVER
jgi:hypothetical protein